MYKKAISGLVILNLIFLFSFLCVEGIARSRQSALSVCRVQAEERTFACSDGSTLGIVESAVSGQRVLELLELEESGKYRLEKEELEILMRIVEAEAGNQDADGRLLVANVVLNRMKNEDFPDSVREVVLQNANGIYQFSPVASGRIWKVQVSPETSEAVERALAGEDLSDGALYFAAREYADKRMMRWFDENLTYLFEYGGHEFFR